MYFFDLEWFGVDLIWSYFIRVLILSIYCDDCPTGFWVIWVGFLCKSGKLDNRNRKNRAIRLEFSSSSLTKKRKIKHGLRIFLYSTVSACLMTWQLIVNIIHLDKIKFIKQIQQNCDNIFSFCMLTKSEEVAE